MKKILVVEDNLINRELLAEMLERFKCSVTLADNGKIAVDEVKIHDFDLIFMDLHMPVMDGFEAAAEIRKSKQMPIIALTANVMSKDKSRCFDVGMTDYVTKPFEMHEIEKVLKKYCP